MILGADGWSMHPTRFREQAFSAAGLPMTAGWDVCHKSGLKSQSSDFPLPVEAVAWVTFICFQPQGP
jgi:hypothetical protein